jgi:osmotically inducible protein OsmC
VADEDHVDLLMCCVRPGVSTSAIPATAPAKPSPSFAPHARRVRDAHPRGRRPDVIERRATVVWEGDLQGGSGRVTTRNSEVLVAMPITFASRVEEAQGRTSPEELLAAAHAACFAMSLSNVLAKAGTPVDQLEVEATCGLERTDAGLRIASMQLSVAAKYDGADPAALQQAAQTAEERCPVSRALRGNVDIGVDTRVLQDGPVPAEAPTDPTRAA